MAVSLPDLIAWRDKLMEARLRGVRRVRDSDGSEVEYRSDSELARAIASADRAIAEANSTRPGIIRFSTSKGL